jgi:hypothetical protein
MSADGAEVLTVHFDRNALRLTNDVPTRFDLSTAGPGLKVEARMSNRSRYDWGMCTDVRGVLLGDEEEAWTAVSGQLTIQVGPPGIRVSQPWRYRASIQLTGGVRGADRDPRSRAGPITLITWVGSIGGPTR